MSRDDEVSVIQCKDGKWIVRHVMAERTDLVNKDKGEFDDLRDALLAAHQADKRWGNTEYGIRVYEDPNFNE